MSNRRRFSGPTRLLEIALEERGRGTAWSGSCFLVGPPEEGVPGLLAGRFPRLDVLYGDYRIYRRDREAGRGAPGVSLRFGAPWDVQPDPHRLAVIWFPREKDLAVHLLALAGAGLEPGAEALVVGPNRGGIRSAGPLVEVGIGPTVGRRAGRHALLLAARRSVTPVRPDPRVRFAVPAGGRTLTVVSLPGVFSHGELDEGTALLLDALGAPQFERALDWGCGSGAIGAALALGCPRGAVDLADSSACALAAARETLAANRIEAQVVPSDGFSGLEGRYDLIASNPPFHQGIRTTTGTTRRMIEEARAHLVPGGHLVLVANRFLRYRQLLAERVGPVRIAAETGRFRVYEAAAEG